jgi:hypothetical protein
MNVKCSRVASSLVDLARGDELAPRRMELLEAHLRECADCAARLEDERAMSVSLRRLSVETDPPPWNAAAEAALLDAFDAAHVRRRSPRAHHGFVYAAAAAAAAAVVAAAALGLLRHREPPPAIVSAAASSPAPESVSQPAHIVAARESEAKPTPLRRSTTAAAPSRLRPGTAFVVWPGATDLPAFESGHLMRVQLPASVAMSLGLTSRIRGAVVQADVLVGQDGFPRAVRLAP